MASWCRVTVTKLVILIILYSMNEAMHLPGLKIVMLRCFTVYCFTLMLLACYSTSITHP